MKDNSEKCTVYYLHPLWILLLVFLPYSIGFLTGLKFILPAMTSIPASIILYRHLKHGKVFVAVFEMVFYVFWLTVIGLVWMYFSYNHASLAILHGKQYIAEMRPWLEGAISKEGTPSQFIPEHLTHAVIVGISSLISAGFIALYFGTILVNYMNYYVATLMLGSSKPLLLAVIGWHPWSVLRIFSFVILGSACAMPMSMGIGKSGKFDRKKFLVLIAIAIALEIADIALKTFIGSSWRDLIVKNLSQISYP